MGFYFLGFGLILQFIGAWIVE